ncbi:MAG TPA: hypothetical protein VNQ76_14005 [Planctomicrobium sp.]|nr:hypothetical protein [Planctomicrobium sp.]
MLWPIVLPAEITFWLLVLMVGFLTVRAPVWKWKRGRTFVVSSLFAGLLFVPSCLGIMEIVDRFRFGTFQYASFSDVNDFRVERYLPTTAREITLKKFPMGHQAKYSISESELTQYVDGLWKRFGEHSAISGEEFYQSQTHIPAEYHRPLDGPSQFELKFDGLGWKEPEHLIEMHSPVENDGGGAVYFYDRQTQTAYHRGNYW